VQDCANHGAAALCATSHRFYPFLTLALDASFRFLTNGSSALLEEDLRPPESQLVRDQEKIAFFSYRL